MGIMVYSLIMGNAGFCPSAVAPKGITKVKADDATTCGAGLNIMPLTDCCSP